MFVVIFTAVFFFLISINNPAYAKGYGSLLCQQSGYLCYKAKRGDAWGKLFPDEVQRDLVMRINRINTRLHPGTTIALPLSKDMNFMDYSPLPKSIDPPGEKIIFVSIHDLAFGAYGADGVLQYWGPVSTGRDYCPDIGRGCRTSTGNYAIYQKGGRGCVSSKFPVGRGGAPMPYCMYFHGGYALHGSYEVPGYNDSHGCIRMFVNDAQWLNEVFTADEDRIPVIVRK